MAQNKSYAVMQQRVEPHDSLDDFPTPPWAARALCEYLIEDNIECQTVYEPACNRGFLLKGLNDYFGASISSDIHDYGMGYDVRDFLFPGEFPLCEWIITNPPFRLAEQFIEQGLKIATRGVAVIVRSAFLEGIGRYERLFKERPPHVIGQFVERVPMAKGRCLASTVTATAYCWIIWKTDDIAPITRMEWIPPCRKRLERDGDYQ